MFSLKRILLAALAAATIAAGQPALTTIQDTLYRADGTRFSGTLFITWNSFLAGDTSNIATSNLTLQIVNGVLKVSLVPTTTATPGAQYSVKYNSKGITQFTEIWAVPPSAVPLRVRDVRVAQGSIVGPPPVTSPVQIGDITGLANELALRAMNGVGFAVGRTAVINQSGQIDAAAGALTDCVRVDGTSGPCGGGGGNSYVFSDAETPAGNVDGVNTLFVLSNAPSPSSSLTVYRNGLKLALNADYLVTNKSVTFLRSAIPTPGDVISASYRFANPVDANSSFAPPQVICSSIGISTATTVATTLGTCTIPAGTLQGGDRLEVNFQYSHTGATNGFTSQVLIGSTSAVSRAAASGETLLLGKVGFSVNGTNEVYDARTFGASSSEAIAVGVASESIVTSLTIAFTGQMSATGTDTVTLSGFTVVRYPAQTNP